MSLPARSGPHACTMSRHGEIAAPFMMMPSRCCAISVLPSRVSRAQRSAKRVSA
jgi:hypothetical protein